MLHKIKWRVLLALAMIAAGLGAVATPAFASASVAFDSLTVSPTVAGSPTTATLRLHSTSGGCVTLQQLTVAVRFGSTNLDYPDVANASVCTSGYTYIKTKTFASTGTYQFFGAYEFGNVWTNFPTQNVTLTAGTSPNGPPGPWTLAFADEFSGTTVDTAKWSYQSSAESDWSSSPLGTGNPGNQQLEFDQPGNCSVSGGILDITTKPDSITSSSGHHYDWSSCMLNTSPSFSYQYGYIETSAKFPASKGSWPALWTWAAPGHQIGGNGETDAYEYYSDNKTRLYQTQHNTGGGSCIYTLPFDPTTGYHTYGVDIETTGTKWYVDGVLTCSVATTSGGLTNINVDHFVYAVIPPPPGQVSDLLTDYVREWHH